MTVTLTSKGGYFSSAEYHCVFEKNGYMQANTVFSSHLNGWYFGNILFGGLLGLIVVDPLTGAMWRLDEKVHGNLSPDPNATTLITKLQSTPNDAAANSTGTTSLVTRSASKKIWEPGQHRQMWLLVVGVGQYKSPQVPGLPYAKQDAERIRDWAIKLNPEQLTRDNISVLTDEQATRENILNQIDWLRKQALPEDAVMIYFAGHGAPELATDGKGVDAKYLLLYDTNPDSLFSTGFSLDDLTRKLDTVKAKTQLVILEACYTGPVGQEVLKKTPTADLEIRPRYMQEMGESGGRVILSASSGRQMAIGSEEVKGGLFTHYLLLAWGDGSKRLLTDGFDDASEKVRRAANQLGSTQEPAKFGDQNVDVILKP